MNNIIVLKTNSGNLSNVNKSVNGKISDDIKDIKKADKIIFPGVGSYDFAIEKIKELKTYLLEHIDKGKLFLGICLGMQLLFDNSEEGIENGFSIFKGKAVEFKKIKTPHMGWNQVLYDNDNDLFKGISNNSYFYFVHSYYIQLMEFTIAETVYCNNDIEYSFSSAINKDNVFAVQFHPEKSSENGLKLLDNFRRL